MSDMNNNLIRIFLDTTPSLETFHPYATVGFTPPVNTSLLLVFGSVSPVSGPYSVLLSTTSSISSNYTSPANQSYTSSTPWGENAVILYLANLDPTAQYSLQMEYLGTTGAGLGISSALFVYATG